METLQNLRNGDAIYDLTEKMEKVVEAVRQTKKEGSVTLKMSIKPWKGNAEMVIATDEISGKVPEKDKEPTIFFTTEENTLQREDPRQMKFNFQKEEI